MRIHSSHVRHTGDPPAVPPFVARWRVNGATGFSQDLGHAEVRIESWSDCPESRIQLVEMHEQGHAAAIEDLTDAYGIGDAGDHLRTVGTEWRWQNEVESWVRGIESIEDRSRLDLSDFELMLDALNTYRRSYGISDAEWASAREVLIAYAPPHMHDEIRAYVPLEPPAGDPPPQCNDFDSYEPKQDEDEVPLPDIVPGSMGWLDQQILDMIGRWSLGEIRQRYNLPADIPPLVIALDRTR